MERIGYIAARVTILAVATLGFVAPAGALLPGLLFWAALGSMLLGTTLAVVYLYPCPETPRPDSTPTAAYWPPDAQRPLRRTHGSPGSAPIDS